jgi:hypothetical protein
MRPALIVTLSAAILTSSLSPACRGGAVETTRITLDEGNVTALLEATSQHYVDAMRELIGERYRDEYRAIRWESLENAMRRESVARLEYRFTTDGVAGIRVYHAMGGRPLSSVAKSVFEGSTPPGSPATPDSLSDSEIGETAATSAPLADEVAADVADSRFFRTFNGADVRAPMLADDASALDAFVIGGEHRVFDPEFKALRAIERDLRSGAIPRGGSIRGSVSQMACASCERAMTRLSEAYDVDIRLAQLYPSLARTAQAELIAAGRATLRGKLLVDTLSQRPLLAADLLRGAREGQLRRSLSPQAMGRSFKEMPWTRRSFRLGPIPPARRSSGSSEGGSPPRLTPRDPLTGC